MTKKVNFYNVYFYEFIDTDAARDFKEIKDYIIEIINEKSVKQDGFWVLDLSDENQLHQIADVSRYK
ncbi:MAG: hypothetical protein IKP88_01725 [Lachnospiraceae bacterium]|nr:hypothetical protein [Lachnospiraceae bacterium]